MSIIGRSRANDLLKRAGTACGAPTQKITYLADPADDSIGFGAFGDMSGPATLNQCGQKRRRSCARCVLINHRAHLSI
jgi:hypothetical protein